MAQSRSPRTQAVAAEVRVIDDLPVTGGVRVRALAAKGHETDARPIAGFYVRRRYAGDEFEIPNWQTFSSNWMEFIEEPPKEWREKIEEREKKVIEIAAAEANKTQVNPAEALMFAMSQMMRQQAKTAGDFDASSGKFKSAETI
jgi:hypothetical protein